MSEKSSSNPDALNQTMTNGVIAVVLTLGGFALYYGYGDKFKSSQPTAENPPQFNRPQMQPFPSFKKAEFDKVIREIQQQQNFQDQDNPQFQAR
jgi:hypothetical protein